MAYPFGLYGIFRRHDNDPQNQTLVDLYRILIPAAFVMVLFVRSRLVHNELGWRGLLIGFIPCCAFAGAALGQSVDRLRRGAATRPQWLFAGLAALLLVASWTGSIVGFGTYILAPRGTTAFAAHGRMLDAGRVYARVQDLTAFDAIIMSNPAAFENVTRPGNNLPWALFANRRHLIADYEWGLTYSHHIADEVISAQAARLAAVYAGRIDDGDLERLRVLDKVRAIVVAPTDPIAGRDVLAQGGHFRLVERLAGFEIHLAVDR